jgi:hypothetical protein
MRRSMVLAALLLVVAVPLSASQFIELPFDQVASESQYIVRATVDNTWTAWDSAHEIIYTYATLNVSKYFGDTRGPQTLVVREAGGTVDGYTMEAIGFPAIRAGEDVVLMLSQWEDSADLRIHAFNQGKYLVHERFGKEVLVSDPVKQGEARNIDKSGPRANFMGDEPGLSMDEFSGMVAAARMGRGIDHGQRQ